MSKRGVSTPLYMAQAVDKQEATILVQFREAYSIEFEGQIRHFSATNQTRMPYSVAYDFLQMQQAPIFFVDPFEKKQFYGFYGIRD